MAKVEKRVFIFDDDTALVALLQRIAQKQFSKIYTATSCQKALQLIEEEIEDFDLVMTDLNFPDGSGLDILRAAKRKSALTSVVLFTGYASLETAIQALHEGAFDYITKPFTIEQILALLNKMETYLDLKRENIELRKKLEESSNLTNQQHSHYDNFSDEFQKIHTVLKEHGKTLNRLSKELESVLVAVRYNTPSKT